MTQTPKYSSSSSSSSITSSDIYFCIFSDLSEHKGQMAQCQVIWAYCQKYLYQRHLCTLLETSFGIFNIYFFINREVPHSYSSY